MFRLVRAHASRDIRLRNISSQRERSSHYPTSKLRPCRRIEQSRTTIITNMETQRRLVCPFSGMFPRFIGRVSEFMPKSGGLGDKPKRLEQRIAYRYFLHGVRIDEDRENK